MGGESRGGVVRRGRWPLALLVASVCTICLAAPAFAAPLKWSLPTPIDPGNVVAGVSCPSVKLCVAVTNLGDVVTSTNPAGGEWTVTPIEGAPGFGAISCPSSTLCVAVAPRTIIAEIIRGGRVTVSKVIARFSPGTIRPGRPSRIRVRHVHGGWRISFRAGANTTEHLLTIRFADGAQALLDAPRGRLGVTVAAALDRTRPTAIQVVGLRGADRGPAVTITVRTTRSRHR